MPKRNPFGFKQLRAPLAFLFASGCAIALQACKPAQLSSPSQAVLASTEEEVSPGPKDPDQEKSDASSNKENGVIRKADSGKSLGLPSLHFGFPQPQKTTRHLTLWATYYYTPEIKASKSGEVPIRGKDERSLFGDEKVSRKDWCDLALQGSGSVILSTGERVTLSFAGRSTQNTLQCLGLGIIETPDIAHTIRGNRFEKVNLYYGRGSAVANVFPFRTIAVDPRHVPYGSVVYIPQARGKTVTFENGETAVHDGYFLAGDTGGAITGNHIDVFAGAQRKAPFAFIQGESKPFSAQIVSEPEIEKKLKDLHGYNGPE